MYQQRQCLPIGQLNPPATKIKLQLLAFKEHTSEMNDCCLTAKPFSEKKGKKCFDTTLTQMYDLQCGEFYAYCVGL